jgi:hypothetical protein
VGEIGDQPWRDDDVDEFAWTAIGLSAWARTERRADFRQKMLLQRGLIAHAPSVRRKQAHQMLQLRAHSAEHAFRCTSPHMYDGRSRQPTTPPLAPILLSLCRLQGKVNVFRGVSRRLRDCLVRPEMAAYRQDQSVRNADPPQLIATELSPAARGQILRSERKDATEALAMGRSRIAMLTGLTAQSPFAVDSHTLLARAVQVIRSMNQGTERFRDRKTSSTFCSYQSPTR